MWRLVAPVLALLLLAASFFRAGNEVMVVAVAGLLILLAVPQPWAARTVQVALALGALRWVWMAWAMAGVRVAAGVPYLRMVLILGAVAVLTLLATAVFQSGRLRRYYRLDAGSST